MVALDAMEQHDRDVYDCSASSNNPWKTADTIGGMIPGIWRTQCPQSEYDNAADLHIYAAHAHTAAAAAHHRGDHEATEELSSKAQDYSMAASEKTLEIAKQVHAPMRT
jgi:hypothetical protein